MKRFIAALLTVAMVVSFVPFSVFAEESSTESLPEASAESTAAQQEEMARALQSTYNPFGRNYVSTQTEESQSQQAEVDTSDVSLTATNSFGQLLVNSMDEQTGTNGEYTSRVTGLKMNGHTATVEFVADKAADLVVAVYTDSNAEEMVASGTAEVSGNGGNDSVSVAIQGEIPEYYTVKAFLLNKNTHEPLSQVYTDSSRTKVMVDLSTAKASDFPEDRVINLDGQDDTNFAVVSDETTLVTYENNIAGKNQVISEDDDALVYVIGNASDEIKNLQPNDILTYEYEPGVMLIARVQNITVSGDTVTIYGDDTLDISDVFDAVKIESDADSGDFTYDGTEADAGVEYNGTSYDEPDEIDLTNAAGQGEIKVGNEFILKEAGDSNLKVKGSIKISLGIKIQYYFANDMTFISDSNEFEVTGAVSFSAKSEGEIKLGSLGVRPIFGVWVGFEPVVKGKAEITGKLQLKYTATIGAEYYSSSGFSNTSKEPEVEFNISAEGSLYIGFDFKPKAKILEKVTVLTLDAEVGAELKGTKKIATIDNDTFNDESRHACAGCFEVKVSTIVKVGATLEIIGITPKKKQFAELTLGPLEGYYSPEYDEWGWNKCPHELYRVILSVDQEDPQGISYLMGSMSDVLEGKAKALGGVALENGKMRCYLAPGTYTVAAVKGSNVPYGDATFTITKNAVDVQIKAGSIDISKPEPDKPGTGENPEPDQPDEPETPDYVIENGRLTINSENIMLDYESAEETPWHNSRDEIDRILTQYMVKKISSYAFADCDKVTEVHIGDEITEIGDYAFSGCSSLKKITFVGTMAKWKEIQIGIGNDLLNEVTIICSDGVINASEDENVLASGKCGENLFWYVTENVELIIVGKGDMYDYGYMNAPWYTVKKANGYTTKIQSVQLSDGMTKIGNYAFMDAPIKEVDIPDSVKVIGTGAFRSCGNLEEVFIPNGVTEIGESSFSGCHNIKNVTGMENVTKIGSGAFASCSGLTSIEIPDSVIEIGSKAFTSCTNLVDATLPHNEAYTIIAAKLFSECKNLKTIDVPDNVTEIEDNAFERCSELVSVSGMKNVKVIGTHSFWVCEKLVEIHLTDAIEKIGVGAFAGCAQISQVKLPQNTEYTKVNDETFWGCKNLTDVDIPNNVTGIGESAFAGCEKMKTLLLPPNMTTIGTRAFSGCTMLETIEIPCGVTRIGASAFSECSKLKEVVLQENIRALDTGTFRNSGLVKITLPKTIGSIAPLTFENCAELSDIVFIGTKDEWSKVVIYTSGNDVLKSATIHCTDGDILPEDTSSENSITTGSVAANNGTFCAAFDNVSAGKDYAVIISRSESDPLNPDNLIYINQITAAADGELSVPFRTGASIGEMVYVVACARDDITIDPVQPTDPVDPDTPSGGGDGAGAAIAIVGGVVAVAAVATVVGVVLMMPVEVSGTVKCADQAVLPAAVQVLQGDKVVAETVTDAEGRFTVKVRRGSYTLRVRYVGADGYPVTKTVEIKAPSKNMDVAA